MAPSFERALGVGNQCRQIGPLLDPQSLARRAPSERTVEREAVGRQLLETPAALMAGEMETVAVDNPFVFGSRIVDARHEDRPAAQIEGRLDRAGDPRPRLGIDGDPVDDDLDGMLPPPIDLRHVFEPIDFSIDADPQESLQLHALPERVVALSHRDFLRRQQDQLRGRGECEDLVDDLVRRLRLDRDRQSGQYSLPSRAYRIRR